MAAKDQDGDLAAHLQALSRTDVGEGKLGLVEGALDGDGAVGRRLGDLGPVVADPGGQKRLYLGFKIEMTMLVI